MAATTTVRLGPGERFDVAAEPLTATGFAPFGSVAADPRPATHPALPGDGGALAANAVVANQGTAIQYRDVTRPRNLYAAAPSGSAGEAKMSLFVCAARAPAADADADDDSDDAVPVPVPVPVPVRFLERHPYTTQTFSPLRSTARAYLVVVAPGQPSGADLPDLARARAFVASDAQAVTYAPGTWHAPMVVLGRRGAALAFVVTQFASGVAAEDCQLVEYVAAAGGADARVGLVVRLGPRAAKL